jgi:hypothetical protein
MQAYSLGGELGVGWVMLECEFPVRGDAKLIESTSKRFDPRLLVARMFAMPTTDEAAHEKRTKTPTTFCHGN